FVHFTSDGSLKRRGTGAVDDPHHELFSGQVPAPIFANLRDQITPELLAWCGHSYADPVPRGQIVQLLIGFKTANGAEALGAWEYGDESFEVPLEIYDFVATAVRLTDPWYDT
ncbi:MAG TPA: hypothetical protein VL096_14705, partial [Pirellulaceae bacterium]|nr:hypothetical protein [Pirellulaceae bacterium]